MLLPREHEPIGMIKSPGGFEFGLQGWHPPEQKVSTITFFTNGTVRVCDQRGQPIRGVVRPSGTAIYFAMMPPQEDDPNPGYRTSADAGGKQVLVKLAAHAEVVEALAEEHVDWTKLTWAGWPQLTYTQLRALPALPKTPIEELKKITDPQARKDALRIRREVDAEREKEMQAVDDME